jgi:hypothetical protein
MSKTSKRAKRREKARQRHDRRVEAGDLIEVLWENAILRVKPTVAEVADQFQAIRSAAAAHEIDVAASVARWGRTSTLHVQFNSWATGERLLDWWPGNGTWLRRHTGERGSEDDWREVIALAAEVR